MNKDCIGVGLIGVGRHGMRYARHIVHDLSNTSLRAVCRQHPEQGLDLPGAPSVNVYKEPQSLIADPMVDVVIVVTPPVFSLDICRVAVQSRKPLLIEKPLATTAADAHAMVDYRFDTLIRAADAMMVYKYVVKNVARRHGKTACFMPKPLFGDNGSDMHTHMSLWKKGKPLFAGNEYAGLSQMALYYIGGLLKHAKALCAICNPTTNSYKRLVPGYEAPVNLTYSGRNRSAAVRIPMYSENPKAKRIEYRPPDPAANPYLAFAALLMAGLDGVLNKIDPGEPLYTSI